jgi:hypothetical protein
MEDYMPGKSLMIFKLHHTVTDGYGLMTFFSNIADNPDEINFGHLPKVSLMSKILMWITMPYYFIKIALTLLPYP